MTTPKRDTTPPPVTLFARQNVAQVFEQYHLDKETENLISECYFDKRPKTYPQIYRRIYDLSRNSKFAFHVVSWCIAISFIQSLVPILLNAAGLPLLHPLQSWLIGGVILGFFEYGQHQTLETLWTVYFQTKRVVLGIAFLTLLFSIISVVSSTYAAFILLSESSYQYGLVAFALFVEFMILTNSYNIHNYRQKTANTVKMLNDFGNGIDTGMYFHNQPQNANLPINDNPIAVTSAKINRQQGATKIVKPSQSQVEHFGKRAKVFQQSQKTVTPLETPIVAPVIVPTVVPVTTVDSTSAIVPSQKLKNVVRTKVLPNSKYEPIKAKKVAKKASKSPVWNLAEVKRNIRAYQSKLEKYGDSFPRCAQLAYFEHLKNNWENLNSGGVVKRVATEKRYEWFEQHFPKKAEQLKAN